MMSRNILMSSGSVGITIAATVRSPDIAALARARGWNGSGLITCTINSGVDVAALNIIGIPNDCLTIINKGRIGGVVNGGTGLYTRTRIRIDNSAGTIFGGGGQGGKGGDGAIRNPYSTSYTADGYGGAGGQGAGFSASGSVSMVSALAGSAGTSQQLSGPSSGGTLGTVYGGQGGTGGAIGVAGGFGNSATAGNGQYEVIVLYSGASGAAAGAYVDGNSYVTWIANGTRQGSAIN